MSMLIIVVTLVPLSSYPINKILHAAAAAARTTLLLLALLVLGVSHAALHVQTVPVELVILAPEQETKLVVVLLFFLRHLLELPGRTFVRAEWVKEHGEI